MFPRLSRYFSSFKLPFTCSYLQQEIKWSDPWRIVQMYERIVLVAPTDPTLWYDYTDFLELRLKIHDQILQTYERAMRNVPWYATMWKKYMLAVERAGKPLTDVETVFQQGVKRGFQDYREGAGIWLTYAYAVKRYADKESAVSVGPLDPARYTGVLKALEMGAENLKDQLGERNWDPDLVYRKAWVYFLGRQGDTGKMREVMNTMVQGGNGKFGPVWLFMLNLERRFGTVDQARRLLIKAVNSVDPDCGSGEVFQTMVQFEREEGTLEDLDAGMKRVEAQIQRQTERQKFRRQKWQGATNTDSAAQKAKEEKLAAKAERRRIWEEKQKAKAGNVNGVAEQVNENAAAVVAPVKNPSEGASISPTSRKREYSRVSPVPSEDSRESKDEGRKHSPPQKDAQGFAIPSSLALPPKRQKLDSSKSPDTPHPPPNTPTTPEADSGVPVATAMETAGPSSSSAEPAAPEVKPGPKKEELFAPGRDESKKGRTVFVSNLPYSVKEQDVRKAFEAVGTIKDLRLVGRKGFAYVEMSSADELAAALLLDRQLVAGRPMFVTVYEEDQKKRPVHYETGINKRKLFVKNFHKDTDEDELKGIFAGFEGMVNFTFVRDKAGRPKGFAYVEYGSEAQATAALMKTDEMEVKGQKLQVAISNPPPKRGPHSAPGASRFMGGTPRARLLAPRSTMVSQPVKPQVQRKISQGKDQPTIGMSNAKFREMLFKK